MNEAPVNSPSWWDGYHATAWVRSGGRDQTRLFMRALVEALPERIAEVIRGERLSIVDWGCAMGEGARVLEEAFPESRVGGLEVSTAAVTAARQAHPDLWFEVTEGTGLPASYDVVVTSNCLEHFRAPLAIVREHLPCCRWFYVALVPYNEWPLHEQHFAQFREESFPSEIAGFERLVCNVIRVPPEAWDGDQLLVVYGAPRALQRLGTAADETTALSGLLERLDGLRASVDRLVSERGWRDESRRIWDALQSEQERCRELVARLADARDELEVHRCARLAADARCADLGRRLGELETSLAESVREAAAIARSHADYREWVDSSRALRAARSLGRLRYVLFPKGSLRERVAWKTKLRLASLWHGARRSVRGGAARRAAPAPTDVAFAGRREGLVTVVLPVYNQADLLESAIESVLAQEFGDFELIVLNDGSSDRVEQVLERHVRDPRVRVLTQTNQKLPKALSNAFEFAVGELWCWTSADNLMEPAQLARQAEYLAAHPDVSMVYCDYYAIDDRGELLRDPSFRPHNRREPTSPEIHVQRSTRDLNVVKDNFIGPCFMYRGTVGRVLGEYDPRLGMEDYDYWMRMSHDYRIEHLGSDELLYRYRVHDNSLSGRAEELGIYAAGDALMEYERLRARAYAKPVVVRFDAAVFTEDEVAAIPHAERADAVADRPDGPAVVVTTPARLVAIAAAELRDDVALVAVVREDAVESLRHRMTLRRWADHCIALHSETGDFLGAIHPSVFVAADLGRGVEAVRSAWRNDLFYRAQRPVELRQRRLPAPFFGSSPLRVLLQVDHLGSGGLERALVMLAEHMIRTRCAEVLVLIVDRAPDARGVAMLGDLRWTALPTGETSEAAYRQLLRDERIDVVNAVYSTFGVAVAAEHGIPFVQTVQNTYVWLGPHERERFRRADEHTAAYLCVSDRVAYYSWRRLGLDPAKMIVLPNPARLQVAPGALDEQAARARLGFPAGRFVFLNVASIYPPKAQIVLVESLRRLLDRGLDVQIVCVGPTMDRSYRELVEHRAQELGVADRVFFHDDTDAIDDYYAAADAFALPSYWEGWSLAVNEAVAFHLPLVLSRVGSAEEIAGTAGAELVDPPFGEVDELDAVRVADLVGTADPDYVERFAAAMARAVERPSASRPDVLAPVVAPASVFDACANVLGWIAQGGAAAAARPWAFSPWRCLAERGGRAFARSVIADAATSRDPARPASRSGTGPTGSSPHGTRAP